MNARTLITIRPPFLKPSAMRQSLYARACVIFLVLVNQFQVAISVRINYFQLAFGNAIQVPDDVHRALAERLQPVIDHARPGQRRYPDLGRRRAGRRQHVVHLADRPRCDVGDQGRDHRRRVRPRCRLEGLRADQETDVEQDRHDRRDREDGAEQAEEAEEAE